jgi:ribosome recycling factor
MEADVKTVLTDTEDAMKKAVSHLESELLKIRAGKANPVMLDGIMVDYYGSPTPLNQVAAVQAPEPRLLTVKPWEKNMLQPIERAIIGANLGLNPSNNGEMVRIPVPALSEERRKGLVKQAHDQGEQSRVGVRAARQDGHKAIKKLVADGLSEDAGKRADEKIDNLKDKYEDQITKHLKQKDEEIMTV